MPYNNHLPFTSPSDEKHQNEVRHQGEGRSTHRAHRDGITGPLQLTYTRGTEMEKFAHQRNTADLEYLESYFIQGQSYFSPKDTNCLMILTITFHELSIIIY